MASPMKGGLGMNEISIGIVSTISGLLFIIGQYTTYIFLLKTIGFMKSLRYGALFCILPIILIPFSLYFPKTKNNGAVGIDDDNDNDGTMNWYQLLYLGLIKGFCSIMGSVFSSCATIGANRSIVHPSQRAYMNGVSSMGSSIGRGLGPIFAGVLIASTMKSDLIPSQFSAWFVYSILLIIGSINYIITSMVPDIDNNDNSDDEKNDSTKKHKK